MTANRRLLRLGIIGCGQVTERHHLPALRKVPAIGIVAFADMDQAKLAKVGSLIPGAYRYIDYRELIDNQNIDVVAICTPPHLHSDMATAALDANKHVFVEKPLALNLGDSSRLVQAAKRNGSLKTTVGFNLRAHRLVRRAKQIVQRGELGEITLVRTIFTSSFRLGNEISDWRRNVATGGGVLFELGVHHFDLVRFLLSDENLLTEIAFDSDDIASSYRDGDESAVVTVRTRNGTQIVCAFSESTGENHELEIYGDRGWLRLNCHRSDGLSVFRIGEYQGTVRTRLRQVSQTLLNLPALFTSGDQAASYIEQWRHFANAIANNTAPLCSLYDGHVALQMALAPAESKMKKYEFVSA